MTVTLDPPAETLRRMTIAAGTDPPGPTDHRIRSDYVETHWLPYLGPLALVFARRCDLILSTEHRQAIDVHRLADELGCRPEGVIAAKYRLERFGLATWSPRDTTLTIARHWPQVAAAIATDVHRSVLLDIDDEALASGR